MDNLTAVMLALLSVGGAAAIDAARRWMTSGRTSRRATTKDLIANLNTYASTADQRALEMEARKNAEIAAVERRLDAERRTSAYWRDRSGDQDYVLAQNGITYPKPENIPKGGRRVAE